MDSANGSLTSFQALLNINIKIDNSEVTVTRAVEMRKAVKSKADLLVDLIDKGTLRVAELVHEEWIVNDWAKKAILLYFGIMQLKYMPISDDITFYDKIPLKKDFESMGVRSVPLAIARYGSFMERGVVLMPSYVNIGAYVGEGTMVDTWATVGSCAQIGKHVHLSGGVGIGGVLEPPQAAPVIIEDGAFIGSRCIVVEGVRIGKEAVLGANVVLTASTKIIDVSQNPAVSYKGFVPPRSVVIPGSIPKDFPGGTYHVPCALIIGKRSESTDLKTSLNNALRDFGVSV
jgi:2,3,4,5-tetrahydropyridine-2-carboxylate N-succinyltransferase